MSHAFYYSRVQDHFHIKLQDYLNHHTENLAMTPLQCYTTPCGPTQLNNSMKLSPFSKATSRSVSEKIPSLSWKPKAHYCIRKKPPTVQILSQINLAYITHPISLGPILISSRLGLRKKKFPGFLTKILHAFLVSPVHLVRPVPHNVLSTQQILSCKNISTYSDSLKSRDETPVTLDRTVWHSSYHGRDHKSTNASMQKQTTTRNNEHYIRSVRLPRTWE
jgi:hypothetical protein